MPELAPNQTLWPTRPIYGARAGWVSASQVSIGETGKPSAVSDSTGEVMLEWDGELSADITTSGMGGLDTGSETASTWYALHVIGDSSGNNFPKALLSLSATAPTLPSGYDVFRRIAWIRNDSSGDFMRFTQSGGGSNRYVGYHVSISETQVITNGNATAYTTVDLSAFVPVSARRLELLLSFDPQTSGGRFSVKDPTDPTSFANNMWQFRPGTNLTASVMMPITASCNADQEIQYAVTASQDSLDISVRAYEDML